jgi:hypothetical protein
MMAAFSEELNHLENWRKSTVKMRGENKICNGRGIS